ncbi:MAG: hypothetical protein AAGE43_19345, partial [Pseudomonadota bacterium]
RERSDRYLADLDAEVTTFDSQDRIAAIVNSLTLEDMTDYLTETMTRLEEARLLIYNRGRFETVPTVGRQLDNGGSLEDRGETVAD